MCWLRVKSWDSVLCTTRHRDHSLVDTNLIAWLLPSYLEHQNAPWCGRRVYLPPWGVTRRGGIAAFWQINLVTQSVSWCYKLLILLQNSGSSTGMRKKRIRNSVKQSCPAIIYIREVVYFQNFRVCNLFYSTYMYLFLLELVSCCPDSMFECVGIMQFLLIFRLRIY